jgi:hypothetical protein
LALVWLPSAAGAQVIERISTSSAGLGGNGASALACRAAPITADGRYVVFQSDAPDPVDGDLNGVGGVFLCRGPAAIFADGFDTGDDSGWSSVSPP